MKKTILLLPVIALAVGCAHHNDQPRANKTFYDTAWYQSQAIPTGRVPLDQLPGDRETVAKGEPGEFVHVKSTKEEASSPVQTAEAKTEPAPAGTTEQPVQVWTTEAPAVGAPVGEPQIITGTEVQGPPAPAPEAVPAPPAVEPPSEPVTPPPAETPAVPPQP